jgi:hypothetical protein
MPNPNDPFNPAAKPVPAKAQPEGGKAPKPTTQPEDTVTSRVSGIGPKTAFNDPDKANPVDAPAAFAVAKSAEEFGKGTQVKQDRILARAKEVYAEFCKSKGFLGDYDSLSHNERGFWHSVAAKLEN